MKLYNPQFQPLRIPSYRNKPGNYEDPQTGGPVVTDEVDTLSLGHRESDGYGAGMTLGACTTCGSGYGPDGEAANTCGTANGGGSEEGRG